MKTACFMFLKLYLHHCLSILRLLDKILWGEWFKLTKGGERHALFKAVTVQGFHHYRWIDILFPRLLSPQLKWWETSSYLWRPWKVWGSQGSEIIPPVWISLCPVAIAQDLKYRYPMTGPSGTVVYERAQALGRGTVPVSCRHIGRPGQYTSFSPLHPSQKQHTYVIKLYLLVKAADGIM